MHEFYRGAQIAWLRRDGRGRLIVDPVAGVVVVAAQGDSCLLWACPVSVGEDGRLAGDLVLGEPERLADFDAIPWRFTEQERVDRLVPRDEPAPVHRGAGARRNTGAAGCARWAAPAPAC